MKKRTKYLHRKMGLIADPANMATKSESGQKHIYARKQQFYCCIKIGTSSSSGLTIPPGLWRLFDSGFRHICNSKLSSAIWKKKCTSEFFKSPSKLHDSKGRVQFEVFENPSSVCFSKLQEKTHYYVLIIYMKKYTEGNSCLHAK